MAAGTLYTYPDNFRAAKALIAAQYSKADVKVAPDFVFGETNKTQEFQQKFPGGKVPAFEAKDGKVLQDSNAIAYYLANDQLKGKNEYDRAQILQWIGFAEGELLPAGCAWVFPILGIIKNDPSSQEAFQRAKDDMKTTLAILNSHLLTRTYLVGERITLADIVVACNLLNPYKFVLDPDYRKSFANVNRWFVTLINQPQFKAVLGDVVLCSKPAQPGVIQASGDNLCQNNKKFFAYFGMSKLSFRQLLENIKQEISKEDTVLRRCIPPEEKLCLTLSYLQAAESKNNVKNKENKHKENKEKQREKSNESSEKDKTEITIEKSSKKKGKNKKKEDKKQDKKEKPKKETPKKEKEPEEELDAAEAALAAEPKSKDPLDALPKGTFVMDDFKRVYSNEEEAKSIPYFWEKFDPENYSIWYGEYKYADELTKVFMSCNLISGMYQRLDKMRKNAFASVCLFGEDNNSTISGVWIWRGQDLAFTLSPDWQIDYEVYDWKKLDPKSEETKNLVKQYLSWSGTDKDGRKFNQGKIFK